MAEQVVSDLEIARDLVAIFGMGYVLFCVEEAIDQASFQKVIRYYFARPPEESGLAEGALDSGNVLVAHPLEEGGFGAAIKRARVELERREALKG